MKPLVIILGLICAALAFAYYKSHTGATEELEQATQGFATQSNKVMELTTRLNLTNGTNEIARTNLMHVLDRRTLEVLNLSNRLVQTRLLLKQTQADAQEAQAAFQAKASQIGTAEAQRDELSRQLEMLAPVQKQLADANRKLSEVLTDRELWAQEAQRLQVEKGEMQAKLENPSFLRVQLAKVQDEAEMKRRYSQGRIPDAHDRRVQLQLQEDESVRAIKVSSAQR